MGEQPLHAGVEPVALLRRAEQLIHDPSKRLPEFYPSFAVRLPQPAEKLQCTAHEAVRDPTVDRLRYPPAAALAHQGVDLTPVLLDPLDRDLDDSLEEQIRLAACCEDTNGVSDHRRKIRLAKLLAQCPLQELAEVRVPERVDEIGQHCRDGARNQWSRCRCGKPGRDALPERHLPTLRQKQVGRKEVALDEAPNGAAYPVLVVWNDGGMGDWQSERAPEKRRYGEPIGDTANHARLGTGLDEQRHKSGPRYHSRCHEDDAHAGEHWRGEEPAPAQPPARRLIGPRR